MGSLFLTEGPQAEGLVGQCQKWAGGFGAPDGTQLCYLHKWGLRERLILIKKKSKRSLLTSWGSISPVPLTPKHASLRLEVKSRSLTRHAAACFKRLLQEESLVGRLILVPHLIEKRISKSKAEKNHNQTGSLHLARVGDHPTPLFIDLF